MFQPENNTQPGDQHSIRNILNPRFPRAVPNLTSAISYHVAYCTPATPSPEFPVFNPSRNDDMATQISSLKCNKSDIIENVCDIAIFPSLVRHRQTNYLTAKKNHEKSSLTCELLHL